VGYISSLFKYILASYFSESFLDLSSPVYLTIGISFKCYTAAYTFDIEGICDIVLVYFNF